MKGEIGMSDLARREAELRAPNCGAWLTVDAGQDPMLTVWCALEAGHAADHEAHLYPCPAGTKSTSVVCLWWDMGDGDVRCGNA